MSMGNNSSTYAPITRESVEVLKSIYTYVPTDLVDELYEIFTNRLTTETLSFSVLMNMLDRYYRGEKGSLWYSVVRKDGTGKMQSKTQKLIHDVMVELHMAQRAMENMQVALAKRGITFVSCHSCGGETIALSEKGAWLEANANEEALRTRLDWEGTHTLYESSDEVVSLGKTTKEEMQVLEDCFVSAKKALEAKSSLTFSVVQAEVEKV